MPSLRVSVIPRAVLVLIVAFAVTCSAPDPGPPVADAATAFRIPVTVETDQGPLIFQAEIADSVDERTRGLMFRESMGDDQGMLFLFPREQQLSFWMKNTFIPLDIIFIRSDRTILGIAENAVPQTMTSRRVPGNSQFVLEINGGLSAQRGIRAGQTVRFMAPIPDS